MLITNNPEFNFALQNNPEHVISNIYSEIHMQNIYFKKLAEETDKKLDKYSTTIENLQKEIKFYEWYLNTSFFKKLIWKIRNLSINNIKNKYYAGI